MAFVLTRSFGATFGDLLTTKPFEKGGLNGTLGSLAILFVILAILIAISMARIKQTEKSLD